MMSRAAIATIALLFLVSCRERVVCASTEQLALTDEAPAQAAADGNLERCGAAWHPTTDAVCALSSSADEEALTSCPGGCGDRCAPDDCVTASPILVDEPACFCRRPCDDDADCDDGDWCVCGQATAAGQRLDAQCVAGCDSDDDCASGERCLAAAGDPLARFGIVFACTSSSDECAPDDGNACGDGSACLLRDGRFACAVVGEE